MARPDVPTGPPSKKALRRYFLEWSTYMAQELENLSAAVDKELADDAAQNELIAELKRQLGEAQAAVDSAQAGEADALGKASEALSAAQTAADRLGSNDAPAEEPGA